MPLVDPEEKGARRPPLSRDLQLALLSDPVLYRYDLLLDSVDLKFTALYDARVFYVVDALATYFRTDDLLLSEMLDRRSLGFFVLDRL